MLLRPLPPLRSAAAQGGGGRAAGSDGASLAALVARAADGDVGAFEQLVREHQPTVFRFALALTADRDAAADLAQEALLKVYRSIGSYRFESSFSTWLFRIVKNAYLDSVKSRQAHERALESPLDDAAEQLAEAAIAEDGLLRAESRRAFWRLVERVPLAYRTIVVLFDVEGMSYDEISRVLGVPVGTVKSRLNRGREALRTELFLSRKQEVDR